MSKLRVTTEKDRNFERHPSIFEGNKRISILSEVEIILVKANTKESLLNLVKKIYGRDNMGIRYVDADIYIDTDRYSEDIGEAEPIISRLYNDPSNNISVVQRRYIDIQKTKDNNYVLKLELYFPRTGGLDTKKFRHIHILEDLSKEFGVDIKGRGFSENFYREYSIKNGKKKRYRFAWYNQMFYRFY